MEKEFKSFYKTVGDNEGSKCHYPTRLDTYGCGCGHDCKYCYAKSQLGARKNWDPLNPSVADIEKIRLQISKLPKHSIVRLGGMTDCFQPIEKNKRVTFETIKILNEYRIGYLIVTKSALVASDEYIEMMDKDLAHIQISITSTSDKLSATYEKASPPSKRIEAIEKLQEKGFDVAVRLSPLIPGYYDEGIINSIKCDKILIEFLRNDAFIKQWFDIDWSDWTVRESNYGHLPLERKIELISRITAYKEISICEDCSEHYEYWKNSFNPNPKDCCNLRLPNNILDENEERRTAMIEARNNEKRTVVNKSRQIKVTFPSGVIFEGKQASKTFFDVINHIGADIVRDLGIVVRGCNLVCIDPLEMKEIYRAQESKHILSNGMYLFTHMSTEVKVGILVDINRRLNLGYSIEYI